MAKNFVAPSKLIEQNDNFEVACTCHNLDKDFVSRSK